MDDLDRIKKVEREVAGKVERARAGAEKKVFEAREKQEGFLEKKISDARRKVDADVALAEKSAGAEAEAILDGVREKIKKLRRTSAEREREAVDFILREVGV